MVILRESGPEGQGFPIFEAPRSQTHHTTLGTTLWMIDQLNAETSPAQHAQETDIHAPPIGNRTRNPSKPAAAERNVRPLDHRDWSFHILVLTHSQITVRFMGRDSSVGKATRYGSIVRGSKPGGSDIFRTRPDRRWGPPNLLYNAYRVFPGGKAAGAWRGPLTPV